MVMIALNTGEQHESIHHSKSSCKGFIMAVWNQWTGLLLQHNYYSKICLYMHMQLNKQWKNQDVHVHAAGVNVVSCDQHSNIILEQWLWCVGSSKIFLHDANCNLQLEQYITVTSSNQIKHFCNSSSAPQLAGAVLLHQCDGVLVGIISYHTYKQGRT